MKPNHIGIILDGNRRYAKKNALNPLEGHYHGKEKVKELLDWCKELKIKELTLYTFSVENFSRSKKEVLYLMQLFKKAFIELKNDKRIKDMRINFIGKISLFPKAIQKVMHELMELTKTHTKFILNFAMGYGGKSEIIETTKKIALLVKQNKIKPENIDEELFKNNLYLKSYPDLVGLAWNPDRGTAGQLILVGVENGSQGVVVSYNPPTNTWATISSQLFGFDSTVQFAEYAPISKYTMIGSDSVAWTLSPQGAITNVPAYPSCYPRINRNGIIHADPVTGNFVMLCGAGSASWHIYNQRDFPAACCAGLPNPQ